MLGKTIRFTKWIYDALRFRLKNIICVYITIKGKRFCLCSNYERLFEIRFCRITGMICHIIVKMSGIMSYNFLVSWHFRRLFSCFSCFISYVLCIALYRYVHTIYERNKLSVLDKILFYYMLVAYKTNLFTPNIYQKLYFIHNIIFYSYAVR